MWGHLVCCSVMVLKLQCVAVCCSVLQCVVVCCSVLQCDTALWCSSCSVELCVAVCCCVRLHRIQMCCNRCVNSDIVPVCVWNVTRRNTLQHTATHCNTLQHHTVAIDMLASWLHVCPNTTAPLQCNTLQHYYSETHNMSTHHCNTHCNTHCKTQQRNAQYVNASGTQHKLPAHVIIYRNCKLYSQTTCQTKPTKQDQKQASLGYPPSAFNTNCDFTLQESEWLICGGHLSPKKKLNLTWYAI